MATNAISLNGSTQYGQIATFSGFDALTDHTVELWVQNTATSAAYSPMYGIGDGTGGGSDANRFSRILTENSVGSTGCNWEISHSGTDADGYKSSDVFPQATWSHVAVVYNDTIKKGSVFRDGVEINAYNLQNTADGTIRDSTGMFMNIGAEHDLGAYFDGDFGGFVRVWTRALTGAEIYANYNKTLTAANEDSSLVVNCNFTEGSGSTVDNDATAGADITLVNTPTWVTGPTLTAKTYSGTNVYAQVAASSDDAEEASAGGTPDLISSDLEITTDGAVQQIVGVRFDNLTIPNGATINSAYLRLVGDETKVDTVTSSIAAEDVDDAATFTTGTNNVSGRTATTATVTWSSMPNSDPGVLVSSPDISTVIQEIVNRAGWASGQAIALLITSGGDTGQLTWESYDGQAYSAPMLEVNYTSSTGRSTASSRGTVSSRTASGARSAVSSRNSV